MDGMDSDAAGLAPIQPALLEDALRAFGESRMLPAEAYTGEAVLRWESRKMFAGSLPSIGRTADVRAAGTQSARTVGDLGVVLTATGRGAVRAFANTCRHRAHELLGDGECNDRRALVCPYHGWS